MNSRADGGPLDELEHQLRMARESALLGNYTTALVYHDGCVASIQRYLRMIDDPVERDRWLKVKDELAAEVKTIKELTKELGALRLAPGSQAPESAKPADPPEWLRPSRPAARKHRKGSAKSSAASGAAGGGGGAMPGWAQRLSKPSGGGGGGGGGGSKRSGAGRAGSKASAGSKAGKRGAGASGAGGKKGGKAAGGGARRGEGQKLVRGRQPYSEVHAAHPDHQLIEMVERDILEVNPNVKFEDIAGLEEAKGLIQEAVVLPLIIPDYFQGIRQPWKGVLMFGPPGTGKTLVAKAVATECDTTFFNVTASTLASKWRGESEKIVRLLFDMARYYAPSTIFIDEIDALAGARGGNTEHESSRRVKTELLVQMDGVSSITPPDDGEDDDDDEEGKPPRVIVLAASNLPWALDDAFRRRLEKRIYIPLPARPDREALIRLAMRTVPLADDVDVERLAEMTDGYSGADLSAVCRDAAMMSMRKVLAEARQHGVSLADLRSVVEQSLDTATAPVCQADFEQAVRKRSPSVGTQDLVKYQQWMDEFGAV